MTGVQTCALPILLQAAQTLAAEYPWLDIHAACADFTTELVIPDSAVDTNRVAFFPGSSIGNFEPRAARHFLRHLGQTLGNGGGLLIGVDLKKPAGVLHAAYNDRQGITAAFNRNLMTRINHELAADFKLDLFDHYAFYNPQQGRVEMHLVSTQAQMVSIGEAAFHFERGESIHTECSYKYSIAEFQALAESAGFKAIKVWTDIEQLFSVHYFEYQR